MTRAEMKRLRRLLTMLHRLHKVVFVLHRFFQDAGLPFNLICFPLFRVSTALFGRLVVLSDVYEKAAKREIAQLEQQLLTLHAAIDLRTPKPEQRA